MASKQETQHGVQGPSFWGWAQGRDVSACLGMATDLSNLEVTPECNGLGAAFGHSQNGIHMGCEKWKNSGIFHLQVASALKEYVLVFQPHHLKSSQGEQDCDSG